MNNLSIEQLKKLSTPRLLAYKRKYYRHKHYTERWNDGDNCFDPIEHNKMFFAIREILNTREHVVRKQEKKVRG
jgi:hypothetical protein